MLYVNRPKKLRTTQNLNYVASQLSHIMRNPAFAYEKNKAADQLHGYHAADQGLCFPYIDSTIPLLPKLEILSF